MNLGGAGSAIKKQKKQIRDYLIWIAFLISCFHNFACMEDEIGMQKLMKCTANGANRAFCVKRVLCILWGSISAAFVCLIQFISIHLAWPLYGWESTKLSTDSITAFSHAVPDYSILYFLIGVVFMCMLAGAAAALLILQLSKLIKKPLAAMAASFLFLGLPAVFALVWYLEIP